MRTKLTAIVGTTAALLLAVNSADAQAPSSLAGDGFVAEITGGTSPFASYGYYILISANTGNAYQVIGVHNVLNSSGTATYTPTGPSTATLRMNASVVGFGTVSTTFATLNPGTSLLTLDSYPGASQTANFKFASSDAPSSIAGNTVVCTVYDGGYPFAFTGSFTVHTSATGNTYTILGDGFWTSSSSGTYSYSLANRSTGKLQLTDALFGVFTVYLGLSDASNGGYAVTQPSTGGYQVGTFVISPDPPVLSGSKQGTKIVLTWPTNSTGFSLQFITNLGSTNWSNAVPAPVTVNGSYTVTNSITNSAKFYRLGN